ncbi:hypothetical protein P8452_46666 [Trifolium repens]|nr:hypothetical protein P8452_46666 [Trifolium repens]
MAKKPETNVKELKPDLEESTTQFRSLLCNKEYHTATTVYAEITLAATHPLHRRKGALRALMVQLEKVLKKLKVNKFILPSLPRSIHIWHQKIGFATVPSWELTLL